MKTFCCNNRDGLDHRFGQNNYNPLGYSWLIRHFGLGEWPLITDARRATRLRTSMGADGRLCHEYPQQYNPGETPLGHLEFALKHEPLNLHLLRSIFRVMGAAPLEEELRAHPNARYGRMLGFYYEMTTGATLAADIVCGGNYVPLLAAEEYLLSPNPKRDKRWRLLDNLLGDRRFCPIIRRTPLLNTSLEKPLKGELHSLLDTFPPELFQRAANYLFFKETRSSWEIEREPMPRSERLGRFVALLRNAAVSPRTTELSDLLAEAGLVRVQNLIAEPRYAVGSFRSNQNYVGEQRPDYSQRIHYIAPPPAFVGSLMAGLADAAQKIAGIDPVARAALLSFGFVFIHPFEDGNGRIHRYLIHEILHRDGFVPPGILLPVSATMLRRLHEYDAALENYSRPLMEGFIRYSVDNAGEVTIDNPDDVEGYYRFPDLTRQTEYLFTTVALTISEDFTSELRFMASFDQARTAIREVADIPDRRLDLLLRLLHQNKGRLSQAKRKMFAELTDAEVAEMENVFAEAFHPVAGNRF